MKNVQKVGNFCEVVVWNFIMKGHLARQIFIALISSFLNAEFKKNLFKKSVKQKKKWEDSKGLVK